MRILGLKYFIVLAGTTSYEWQIGPVFGRFTKLRYWWRCSSWKIDGGRVTHWRDAVFIGYDPDWLTDWDKPETEQ